MLEMIAWFVPKSGFPGKTYEGSPQLAALFMSPELRSVPETDSTWRGPDGGSCAGTRSEEADRPVHNGYWGALLKKAVTAWK